MPTRTPARLLTTAAVAAALTLAGATAASAHVTISPDTAEAGSYALITVKVPNESATATTTSVTVDLPSDEPFTSVSYVPVDGWSTTVTDTSVTWVADDGIGIADGQLVLFPLSLGAVPDTGSITLAASQTYSDGTVVDWNETDDDAEKPAPVLYVGDAPAADHHGAADAAATDETTTDAAATSTSNDTLARGLGIGGLVVGAVGVVLAVTARRRSA